MSASLYENKEKKSEKSPDFSGTVKFNNKEYMMSLWFSKDKQGQIRIARTGGRMLNGKISEPREGGQMRSRRNDNDGDNINDLNFAPPKAKQKAAEMIDEDLF